MLSERGDGQGTWSAQTLEAEAFKEMWRDDNQGAPIPRARPMSGLMLPGQSTSSRVLMGRVGLEGGPDPREVGREGATWDGQQTVCALQDRGVPGSQGGELGPHKA